MDYIYEIATNDLIYWRNGICDRAYYGGDLLDLNMISIDLDTVSIHDETPWAEFVDPYAPNNGLEHVLVFQNEVDFAIMPWWNLGEM